MNYLKQIETAKKFSAKADKRFNITKKFLATFPKGYAIKTPDEMNKLGFHCGIGGEKRIWSIMKNTCYGSVFVFCF